MKYDECLERVNATLTRDYYYRGTSSWSRTYEIGQLRLVDKICFTAVDEMERFCFILVTVWPTLNSEARVSFVFAQTIMTNVYGHEMGAEIMPCDFIYMLLALAL